MPEYKRGDRVLVANYEGGESRERIYLTTIEGAQHPFVCVNHGEEENFQEGNKFNVGLWKHISPLTKRTVDDVLSKLSDEDKEIIKEALK